MFGGDPITRESMPPEQARAAQHEVDGDGRDDQSELLEHEQH